MTDARQASKGEAALAARIDALNAKAAALARTDTAQSLALGAEAYRLATITGYEKGLAESHYHQAYGHYVQTDYVQALAFARKALLLYRKLHGRRGELLTLKMIGGIYSFTGDLGKAINYTRLALAIARAMDDFPAAVSALGNLGWFLYLRGDVAGARAAFEQGRALGPRAGNCSGLQALLINYANLRAHHGEPAGARQLFLAGLELLRAGSNRASLALALNDFGGFYLEHGDSAAALACLEESLALSTELGDHRNTIGALINIGETLLARGDGAAARRHYERARKFARKKGYPRGEALALLRLGQLSLKEDNTAEAGERLDAALAMLAQLELKESAAEAHAGLAEVWALRGNPREAAAHRRAQKKLAGELKRDARSRSYSTLQK
jgi:tetratricopeptide (TPR) repeat protein